MAIAGKRAVIGRLDSKVLGYDGSLNGLTVNAIAGTSGSSAATFTTVGSGLILVGRSDSGNGRQIAVSADGGATFGTPLTIAGVEAGCIMEGVIFSSSLVAVIYVGTSPHPTQIKTFSVSGNALTLDQTLTVEASGAIGRLYNSSLQRASSTRAWCLYENGSAYPTVIGINASAGSLTKDGTAAVLDSSVLSSSGSINQSDISLIDATNGYAVYKNATGLRVAKVTDSGSALSVGTKITIGTSTTQCPFVLATPTALLIGAHDGAIDRSFVYVAKVSSGSISEIFPSAGVISSQDCIQMPYKLGISGSAYKAKGCILGDVEGDDTIWFCSPAIRINPDAGVFSFIFIGISEDGSLKNFNMRVMRQPTNFVQTSVSSQVAERSSLAAITTTKMAFLCYDDNTKDHLCTILNL